VATAAAWEYRPDGYHVRPGDEIQPALQAAAGNQTNKTVWVHAGVYRPSSPRQALIWFHRSHEGVRLEGVGEVTLTAANPDLASADSPHRPAVVNHVVYFGHGLSSNTVLRGVRVTGANGFLSRARTRQIEPDNSVPKNLFFFSDGGGIKIFGRSSPRIERVEVVDNVTGYCGAGVSVQHQGTGAPPVIFEDCVFRNNRTQITGAALDLLAGSQAVVRNCLFVGNVANLGEDRVAQQSGEPPFTNNGALTVFPGSRAWVERCTFTGNRNGADDLGGLSTYLDCVFADNTQPGTRDDLERYELDLPRGGRVSGCVFRGRVLDPQGAVVWADNRRDAPPPDFDPQYVPRSDAYRQAGYRPSGVNTSR